MVALIDTDGMFYGDRMAKLSLMARLYWPYFYAAANAYGRLELNYHRIANRAFASFQQVPSESEVNGYLKEYVDSYLLFVFEFNGQLWGQWDVSEKFLPRHKDAASKRSPDPGPAFLDWKNEYSRLKAQSLRISTLACNVFGNSAQTGEKSRKFVRAVAVAGAVAGVENLCPTDVGQGRPSNVPFDTLDQVPESTKRAKASKEPWERNQAFMEFLDQEFWPEYPRREKKRAAIKALWKVHQQHGLEFLRGKVLAAVCSQKQAGGRLNPANGPAYIPLPAGWLNDAEWENEEAPETSKQSFYSEYREAE